MTKKKLKAIKSNSCLDIFNNFFLTSSIEPKFYTYKYKLKNFCLKLIYFNSNSICGAVTRSRSQCHSL